MTKKLTHTDKRGKARMVNVAKKKATFRRAKARGEIFFNVEAFCAVRNNALQKGDALSAAKVAAVMAAKRTAELIPLCHPLPLAFVGVDFVFHPKTRSISIESVAEGEAKTGFEMEAMVAVSTAALTLYDMAKALDKGIVIQELCLLEKSGGKSGTYKRKNRR